MRYAEIGSSNIKASLIGLGCAPIAGVVDENEALKTIEASINAGITLIDTAPYYGLGKSENIIGKAIKGKRDKVILATKCGVVWHDKKGKPHSYLEKESIQFNLEESLKRLGTTYIDLLQTHWQDKITPIEETMSKLMDLKAQGKIRSIGISNISLAQAKEYAKHGQLDSVQEKFNMIDSTVEKEILPWCISNNIAMLSYYSLESGLLTGKMIPNRKFTGDKNSRFAHANVEKANKLISKFLKPIADKHEITIAQLSIAWLLSRLGVFALCGAINPIQANENAEAGEIVLSEEDKASVLRFINEYSKNCI